MSADPSRQAAWWWLGATFLLAFAATAPWKFGGLTLDRFSNLALASLVLIAVLLAMSRPRRDALRRSLYLSGGELGTRELAGAFLVVSLFVFLWLSGRYRALEVNAWDFSIYYDRPIEATLHGRFLFSDSLGMSTLGNHAGLLSLALLPFYAIHPSPLWLIVAESAGVALGGLAAFRLFRHISGDGSGAAFLALAFVVHPFTVRTARYVFHPEIFYASGLFLTIEGMLRKRRLLFAIGLILCLMVKEDALVPLAGAFLLSIPLRRPRWGTVALLSGIAVFFVDTRLIMPHFNGMKGLWYSGYWASFGSTPLVAAAGMARHPFEVAGRVLHSGAPKLLRSVAFLPLVAPLWSVGALPAMVIYGASDFPKLSMFVLYYSMPLLPFLFVPLPAALLRLARAFSSRGGPEADLIAVRAWFRVGAMLVLLLAMFEGQSYVFLREKAQEGDIATALPEPAGGAITYVQGSLFPHVGYRNDVRPLDASSENVPHSSFLLDPGSDSYPLSAQQWRALVERLSKRRDLKESTTSHGLIRFTAQ